METDPVKAGFHPGQPGHKLQAAKPYPNGYHASTYQVFDCSCGGLSLSTRMVADGTAADSRSTRKFREHLDVINTPDDAVTEIGVVKKKRVTWRVVVFPRTYRDVVLYESGRYKDWSTNLKGWYTHYPWAIGLDKGKSGKVIAGTFQSRNQAIAKAMEILDKNIDAGFEVTYEFDRQTPAAAVLTTSPRDTITKLLDNADVALGGTIGDLESVLEQFSELLSLVPLMQIKHDELLAAKEERTLGLLA